MLNLTYGLSLSASYTSVANTLGTAQDSVSLVPASTLVDGTGAMQANRMYSSDLTLAAAPVTLDLTTLAGGLGQVVLGHVKLVYILNNSAAGTLSIDTSISNSFNPFSAGTPTVSLPPGGFLVLTGPVAGFLVDSTHRLLKLDPGASTIEVQVVLVGTSI